MVNILVRKDDPEQRIELVKWQVTLRGFFGYTPTMLTHHRAPCLFPHCVWKEISESGGAQ
jgi:hypothetical protein